MRVTALMLALSLFSTAPAWARTRRPAPEPDDRPATRAEVAKALEPVIDASHTADGRQITAQDVVNLEDVSIHVSDETAATELRVERLRAEIEQLRADIAQLKRRHRRAFLP